MAYSWVASQTDFGASHESLCLLKRLPGGAVYCYGYRRADIWDDQLMTSDLTPVQKDLKRTQLSSYMTGKLVSKVQLQHLRGFDRALKHSQPSGRQEPLFIEAAISRTR